MMRFCLLSLLFCWTVMAAADNQPLLRLLDETIDKREQFLKKKQERIDFLKQKLKKEKEKTAVLSVIDDLYNEYHVFQFDSARTYASKGLNMARQQKNAYFEALFNIHMAEILAAGGLYSEAVGHLDEVDVQHVDHDLLFGFYYASFSVYSYWSDYCNDQVYTPQYRKIASECLKKAMGYADVSDPLYKFYLGEQKVYVEPDRNKARAFYLNTLKSTNEESRIYAMASYALAGNYRMDGNDRLYEEYLIKAALSDLKSCTMENLALQNLALHLFQQNPDHLERAEKYINISMEDAKFYNNRLRMIEISQIMPQIMDSYQSRVKKQNSNLRFSVVSISLLVLGLVLTSFLVFKQNRKLTARRIELGDNNQQLKQLNLQLANSNLQQAELNEKLQELNRKLLDTNKHREALASIYIDLCAKYIDKLEKFQTLVKRKIKANQAQDLLQTVSSARVSEEDAATFLNRFDKAFLELYPSFVKEFNALLRTDGQIVLKSPHALTTELRTFALIRLGVKNTADIAGLLFLSPQTIYNCRSVTKGKALCKDSFDQDVMSLCTVIHKDDAEM